jgi:hypothetical protein
LALTFAFATTALADALVVVQVRTPEGTATDGEVVLTSREPGGATYRCTTQAGECRIDGVQGGRYVATFTPGAGGESPPPKPVMIPPSGRVTLVVSTR